MNRHLFICVTLVFFTSISSSLAQIRQKQINKQDQAWVSINSTIRISDKWGLVADVHERRNNFFKDPNFHFVRIGAAYWLQDNVVFSAGYAHLWLAPSIVGWHTFANENRIYQQVQMNAKIGAIRLLHRLRNEQRWQRKIINDKPTSDNKFTNRVRYLMSFTVPVFKNPNLPSLVLSDELLMQFGKEIVYNSFDQNRLFFGIRQKISNDLSFDLGYMLVHQQKASGYQYDKNNTFRWFFYYTPDCRKKHTVVKKV